MMQEKIKYSISEDKKFHPYKKILKITWDANIPENDFEFCIVRTKLMIEAFPAETLQIDSTNLHDTALLLDWRIIESSWKEFYSNGGKKIVVINKARQSECLKKEYIDNMDKYGIPIKLEFSEEKDNPMLNQHPVEKS
jgi:hypothetical protein